MLKVIAKFEIRNAKCFGLWVWEEGGGMIRERSEFLNVNAQVTVKTRRYLVCSQTIFLHTFVLQWTLSEVF